MPSETLLLALTPGHLTMRSIQAKRRGTPTKRRKLLFRRAHRHRPRITRPSEPIKISSTSRRTLAFMYYLLLQYMYII